MKRLGLGDVRKIHKRQRFTSKKETEESFHFFE